MHNEKKLREVVRFEHFGTQLSERLQGVSIAIDVLDAINIAVFLIVRTRSDVFNMRLSEPHLCPKKWFVRYYPCEVDPRSNPELRSQTWPSRRYALFHV